MTTLTKTEALELQAQHQALADTSSTAWLSLDHRAARKALAEYVAKLNDRGVPLSTLGAAMGVTKQRAGKLAGVGRLP